MPVRRPIACAATPPAELNALLSSGGFLQADALDYISLLLRVAWREDGALMREKLKQRTLTLLKPAMDEIIAEGVQTGCFTLPRPSLAGSLILRLERTVYRRSGRDPCRPW